MEDFEEQDKHEQPERLFTIEEHARRQGVAPSILAAVMQSEGWANGKKTSETLFKGAVNAFLNAPIGRI